MGSNVKVGRHAKPSTNRAVKKVAAIGAVAAIVPVAGLIFAGQAHAATTSQWDQVAQFEASGDWSINHSSDGCSVGGLQFQSSGDGCSPSWEGALSYLNSHGYDTSSWAQHMHQGMPRSEVPTKDQQILAGEAWLQVAGPGAWANGNASGLVSMFRGGPNPWGLPGTQVPAGLADGSGGTPTVPNPVPADGGQYEVVAGDTLSQIAADHGITLADLEAANPQIADFDLIEIGDMIDIPGTAPAPTPPPYWKNCTDARAHGFHDFREVSSGYRPALDRDHDGIACETSSWPTTPPVVVPPTNPAPGRAPAECDHIVVPGDTVSAVADSVGAPLADVEAVNPGVIAGSRPDDYSLIFSGGHIHMPAGYCGAGA